MSGNLILPIGGLDGDSLLQLAKELIFICKTRLVGDARVSDANALSFLAAGAIMQMHEGSPAHVKEFLYAMADSLDAPSDPILQARALDRLNKALARFVGSQHQ